MAPVRSATALTDAARPELVAKGAPVQGAAGGDAVVRAVDGDAFDPATKRELDEMLFRPRTGALLPELGRPEVRQADLDPGFRPVLGPDAEAVAVADVADYASEPLATAWQGRFTWIGLDLGSDSPGQQRQDEGGSGSHG